MHSNRYGIELATHGISSMGFLMRAYVECGAGSI